MKKIWLGITAIATLATACSSLNNTQKGAGIGAVAGAAAGALIFKKNSALGALGGAVVGGVAGGLIGKHMDKQAKEIQDNVPGAKVERVGEGIDVTFESGLMFTISSANLSDVAKANLDKAAQIFAKYPDTKIRVEGHTDSTGKAEFNMKLSEKRARAVADYLVLKGVSASRLDVKWFGATDPKYTNSTEEGRKQNRRVELVIEANEKMKQDAQNGKLPQ